MTSSQVYPTLSGTVDPEQMGPDATAAGLVGTEWYAQTSSYGYSDPYMTPYPSSTVESQPWTQYARSSVPDINLASYAIHQPVQQPQHPQMFKDPGRPRSSPSTFGPSADAISWPTTTGLGIQYTTAGGHPTPPVTSMFPPIMFQTYPTEEHYDTGTSSPPGIRQPQPRRPYTSIAPNPTAEAKRKRDEDDSQTPEGKRRKRTSSVVSADLNEDDRFLVQLKENESLPWKDIATRFQTDKGKNFQVAALQMRYKRLREKFRIWEEQDVQALKLAYEYWDKYKWEIVSAKMLDFGLTERWPARLCSRKWAELETGTSGPGTSSSTVTTTTAGLTPASTSQFPSPVEGPVHFGFMPMS